MTRTQTDATGGDDGLKTAKDARLESIDSGNYRANSEYIIGDFNDWLRRDRGVTALEELSTTDCRRYAQHLRDDRVRDGDLSPASARKYHDVIRAFLGWCVRDDRLDTNPAESNRVTEELPDEMDRTEDDTEKDQQFWTERQRKVLCRYCDRRVDAALDDRDGLGGESSDDGGDGDEMAVIKAMRDRALVYVLAYSGVRAAEVLNDSRDEKRNGLRWHSVDLDRGLIHVLGKNRDSDGEQAPLIGSAADKLARYRRVLDPPSEDWPVFPTLHVHSLPDVETDDGEHRLLAARRVGVTPPSLSKNGARNRLQDLTEGAGIDLEDGEYLKPHGARRGLGQDIYEESAELAQDVLRHKSVETTHESYRDVQAEERRKAAEDVLFDE